MPEVFNIGDTNYTVKDFLYNPGLVVKHGLSTFVDALSRQRAGAVSISLIITGGGGVRVMVFNTTFNIISAVSWWSVLLMEETGIPCENHRRH